MASEKELRLLAQDTATDVRDGAYKPEELTPKGQLLLRLGRGEMGWHQLSPQDNELLGVDPTAWQTIARNASAAGQQIRDARAAVGGYVRDVVTGQKVDPAMSAKVRALGPTGGAKGLGTRLVETTAPKHQGSVMQTLTQPTREALYGPTFSGMALEAAEREYDRRQRDRRFPERALSLPTDLISGAMHPKGLLAPIITNTERFFNLGPAAGVGLARGLEQAAEQFPRLFGGEAASTPLSRVGGALAEAASYVTPTAWALKKAPPVEFKPRPIDRMAPGEFTPLRPGGESTLPPNRQPRPYQEPGIKIDLPEPAPPAPPLAPGRQPIVAPITPTPTRIPPPPTTPLPGAGEAPKRGGRIITPGEAKAADEAKRRPLPPSAAAPLLVDPQQRPLPPSAGPVPLTREQFRQGARRPLDERGMPEPIPETETLKVTDRRTVVDDSVPSRGEPEKRPYQEPDLPPPAPPSTTLVDAQKRPIGQPPITRPVEPGVPEPTPGGPLVDANKRPIGVPGGPIVESPGGRGPISQPPQPEPPGLLTSPTGEPQLPPPPTELTREQLRQASRRPVGEPPPPLPLARISAPPPEFTVIDRRRRPSPPLALPEADVIPLPDDQGVMLGRQRTPPVPTKGARPGGVQFRPGESTPEGGAPAELPPPAPPPPAGGFTQAPAAPTQAPKPGGRPVVADVKETFNRRSGRFAENVRNDMDVNGFDPENPYHLERFVMDNGGFKPSPTGDLAGELAAIPPRFMGRGGRGLSPAHMAERLNEALGRGSRVWGDDDILARLRRIDNDIANRERRARADRGRLQDYDDLPEDAGDVPPTTADTRPPGIEVSAAEWAAMSPDEQARAIDFLRKLDEAEAPPPSPRGGGGGEVPFGFVPPVPLPGPEEEEEGTLTGYAKRAAQAAGLSLPLAAMLFARYRGAGGRRPPGPRQQGFGFEAGPQRPLPEVPEPPTRGAGAAPEAPPTLPGRPPAAEPGSRGPVPATFHSWWDLQIPGKPPRPPMEQWHLTEDIPGHPKGSTVLRGTLESEGYVVPEPPTPPPGAPPRAPAAPPAMPEAVPPAPKPYEVKVHFATGRGPQVVGTFADEEAAMREARRYFSDSKGVWVNGPGGEIDVKNMPTRYEPPPRVERTQLGDQTLVPGTPTRTIPEGPTRATQPQRDITETPLFGQEREARAGAQENLFQPGKLPEEAPRTPSQTFADIDRDLAGRGRDLDAQPVGARITVERGNALGSLEGQWERVDVGGDPFWRKVGTEEHKPSSAFSGVTTHEAFRLEPALPQVPDVPPPGELKAVPGGRRFTNEDIAESWARSQEREAPVGGYTGNLQDDLPATFEHQRSRWEAMQALERDLAEAQQGGRRFGEPVGPDRLKAMRDELAELRADYDAEYTEFGTTFGQSHADNMRRQVERPDMPPPVPPPPSGTMPPPAGPRPGGIWGGTLFDQRGMADPWKLFGRNREEPPPRAQQPAREEPQRPRTAWDETVARYRAEGPPRAETPPPPAGEMPPPVTAETPPPRPPRVDQAPEVPGEAPDLTPPPPGGPRRAAPPPAEPPPPPSAASAAADATASPEIPPVGWARRGFEYLAMPAISVWEGMGAAGRELSRVVQNKFSAEGRWLGQYAEPLLRQIRTLDKAERESLRQVMEERAAPMNDKVAQAAEAARRLFGKDGIIAQEARKRKMHILGAEGVDPETGEIIRGRVREFEGLEDFFPHEFTPEVKKELMQAHNPRRERAIKHLLDTGQAPDQETAELMLASRFNARRLQYGDRVYFMDPDRYVGGLERERTMNVPDYIRDPEQAFAIRLKKVARRFAELDAYGELDRTIGAPTGYIDPMTGNAVPRHGLIGEIEKTQGRDRAARAHAMFIESLGHRPDVLREAQEAANRITTVQALTKLPLAFISNATQAAQIAVRTDLSTAARGLMRSATRAGWQEARNLGVLTDSLIQEALRENTGSTATGLLGRTTDKVLKPFNAVEKWDRVVGANAGNAWADSLEKWMQGGKRGDFLGRELQRLNFSGQEAADILSRGVFTADERARVAWAIADQTQFMGTPYRKSQFFNQPAGQVIGQFKTFAINSGRLMHQSVIKEAQAGNFKPLATMLVLFPVAGETVADVKSLITGRDRPENPLWRAVDNASMLGGFGLVSELVRQVPYGEAAVYDALFGPTAADVSTLVDKGFRILAAGREEDVDKMTAHIQSLASYGARSVPFVGPIASQQLRGGPQAQLRRELGPVGRLRLGLTPEEDVQAAEKMNREHSEVQRKVNKLAEDGNLAAAREAAARWNALHPGASIEPQREQPLSERERTERRYRRVREPYRTPEMEAEIPFTPRRRRRN